MGKFKKSEILILTFLAALLSVTPLISSSSRPKYLYFVINFLIIALGAEAGLISVFSKPSEGKRIAISSTAKAAATQESPEAKLAPPSGEKKVRVVEKSVSERIVNAAGAKVDKVKKCPSMPSLFFIGGGETELEPEDVAEKKGGAEVLEGVVLEESGGLSGQELFTKAETFIGNFYKQLKMQREESWKRIHGFYQKGF